MLSLYSSLSYYASYSPTEWPWQAKEGPLISGGQRVRQKHEHGQHAKAIFLVSVHMCIYQ